MKITNQTQRLIKVGTVIVLPNDTVEVDATLEQYPALADLAKKGDISVKGAKATTKETTKETSKEDTKEETKETTKGAKKSDKKDEEKDTEEGK